MDLAVLSDFEVLPAEAVAVGPAWALVLAAALPGQVKQPTDRQTEAALQHAVESVQSGQLAGLIPFDSQGHAVQLVRPA